MPLSQGPITVSSMATFLESLQAFLTTAGAGNPGWTDEAAGGGTHTGVDTTNGQWAVSKAGAAGTDTIQIAGKWNTSSPDYLALYQYFDSAGVGNYNDGVEPGLQTNDSGNGYNGGTYTNANLDNERYVRIGNTPIRYWVFTGDIYVYVVVETSANTFVHFGFGQLDKFNDWTGGEFLYGHRIPATGSHVTSADTSWLLDGFLNGTGDQLFAATVHIEGMTDSPASGKWGVSMVDGQGASVLGQDTAGIDRIHIIGGFRCGSHARFFGTQPGATSSGLVPSYPLVIYHIDRDISGTSTFTNSWAPLGAMPEVRGVSVQNYEAGDTIVIGSDTWYVFPMSTKYVSTIIGTSGYVGVMYKANP